MTNIQHDASAIETQASATASPEVVAASQSTRTEQEVRDARAHQQAKIAQYERIAARMEQIATSTDKPEVRQLAHDLKLDALNSASRIRAAIWLGMDFAERARLCADDEPEREGWHATFQPVSARGEL